MPGNHHISFSYTSVACVTFCLAYLAWLASCLFPCCMTFQAGSFTIGIANKPGFVDLEYYSIPSSGDKDRRVVYVSDEGLMQATPSFCAPNTWRLCVELDHGSELRSRSVERMERETWESQFDLPGFATRRFRGCFWETSTSGSVLCLEVPWLWFCSALNIILFHQLMAFAKKRFNSLRC